MEARLPGDQPTPSCAAGDLTPLDFRQRFTGTFSEDGNTISGAREKRLNGSGGTHDFAPYLPQGRLT